MSFAVVLEGMTLVAFIVMLSSGVQKRTSGWKTVTVLLGLVALVQCVAMGLLVCFGAPQVATLDPRLIAVQAHIYEVDDRFFPGWHFDTSFILCTVSWCTQILVGGGLVASAFLLETEGGYELLPQENMMPQTEERAEGFEP